MNPVRYEAAAGNDLSREARRDIEEIRDYIADRNRGAAHSFLSIVQESFDRRAVMPGSGFLRFPDVQGLAGIRMPVLPKPFHIYLIAYRPLPDSVHVARIIHGARDVGSTV